MRPPGRLLFSTSVDALNGEAFFKGVADFASYLVRHDIVHGVRGKKPKSLATYLAQVLVYEDPRRSRPISASLQSQIVDATSHRLTQANVDIEIQNYWLLRLRQAIELDAAARAEPSPLDAEQLFYEVLETTQTANEQFIITAEPSELVPSPRAKFLNEILLKRLGLDQLVSGGESAMESRVKYTFNFPSEDVGFLFWLSLRRGVEQHSKGDLRSPTSEEIRAAFEALVAAGRLVVQQIPPALCACPTVVFEPEESRAVGFNLYYHSDLGERSLVSLAKMDRSTLDFWRRNFFTAIIRREVDVSPIGIPNFH